MPGYTRRRRGKGFSYADQNGARLPAEEVERIRDLAIPPAWTDVWICPYPNGHLQATGLDAAGRRQYLYHPQWRLRRDQSKFDRIASAAAGLPQARRQVEADLALPGMPLERAAAAAVRLLDVGYFRIGNDAYTDAHGSFGLTTLERRHVRRRRQQLIFSFVGKSGISHTIAVDDPVVMKALETMRRRRDDSPRLMASPAGPQLARADQFGRERLPGRPVRRRTDRQGLPHLARHRDRRRGARPQRGGRGHQGVPYPGGAAGGPGSRRLPRQHPDRRPVVLIDPRVIERYQAGGTIADAAGRQFRSAKARQTALEQAALELLDG